MSKPEMESPSAGWAAEGQCTAFGDHANRLYAAKRATGKPPEQSDFAQSTRARKHAAISATDHIGGPIWTWRKPGGGMFIAGLRPFKGRERFDLRLWVDGPDGLRPTGKGVNLPADTVAELGKALTSFADSPRPEPSGE